MRRRETVPAISSAHYYRQRYAVMVVERNFPAIAVAEMRENIEAVVTFVYDGVVKPTLGPQAKRFAP